MRYIKTYESLNEARTEMVLKRYMSDPYKIGAKSIDDDGRAYSLLFSDSTKREESIRKLKAKGIKVSKMKKRGKETDQGYWYELVIVKESLNEDRFSGNDPKAGSTIQRRGFKWSSYEQKADWWNGLSKADRSTIAKSALRNAKRGGDYWEDFSKKEQKLLMKYYV